MIDRLELEKLAARVLAAVKKEAPSADVLARVGSGRKANVRFGANEIESCGDVTEESIDLDVALGKRRASVSGNQIDDPSIAALVSRAVAMARVAPEDPEAMPLLPPQAYTTVPAAYDRAMAEMSSDARAAMAQTAIVSARQAGLNGAGFFRHEGGTLVLASSAGLVAHHGRTYGSFSMTARTKDATGSGWGMRASHESRGIDAGAVARTAAEKAARSAKARPLEPGKYTVVLEPAAVGDLLEFLAEPLSARAVDEGRSALTRPGGGSRLGEAIASPLVSLRSDPADPALPVAPFDPEDGLPRAPIAWIDRGVLSALDYSRFWAAKQGKPPTSGGNWHLTGGEAKSLDELVAGVKRGLLVTRFWYTRVLDPHEASVTGLTRDGVVLIEDGKVTVPVNNFRFNHSPLTMLKNCEAMTRETWRVSAWMRVPALRTAEFNMASISAAV